MNHKKENIKVKKRFWILLILVMLLYFAFLELSKNTIFGWLLSILFLAGYIALEYQILYKQTIWIRIGGWLGLFALFILTAAVSQPPYRQVPAVDIKNPEPTDVRSVEQGDLTGVYNKDHTVEVYAGIPYAKPPVGELRWSVPQEPDQWDGVRVCDHFAPMSMQSRNLPIYDSLVNILIYHNYQIRLHDNYKEPVSEDSLYLNIWKPEGEIQDLPVLVYIHGGSLMTGQSYYSEYNGETLAKKGIVVVNFAYRLGSFGYLATEELAAKTEHGTTGNYGLLDQIQALKWVQKNIAAFGGDPAKVTIAGESAGASSVNALCVSPLSKGLFRYAIAESSGIVAKHPYHTFRPLSDALSSGEELMEELNVNSLEELKQVDASLLLQTHVQNSAMTVDGYAITEQPYLTYEKGNNHEQALLNGFNAYEADIFNMFYHVTEENYLGYLQDAFGDYATEVADLYPPDSVPVANHYLMERGGNAKGGLNRALSGAWFAYSHYKWSNYISEEKKPVYLYYFSKENRSLSANHAGELPYAYGNLWRHNFLYEEADFQVSDAMVEYWANFVKTGNPNGAGLLEWTEYQPEQENALEFGDQISMITDPFVKLYPIIDKYQDCGNCKAMEQSVCDRVGQRLLSYPSLYIFEEAVSKNLLTAFLSHRKVHPMR